MKYLAILAFGLMLFNCKESQETPLTAQTIIDESIDVMGGTLLDSSFIEFKFRDKYYTALRHKGEFSYTRQYLDSSSGANQAIKDVLGNRGFKRLINNEDANVPDSMATKYSASVNSVHYFSILPYGLNDPAVIKKRIADQDINGQAYYTVQVTFQEEGGGEDYEDVFLYWINKDTSKLEYLAYSYNEDDGKGLRFRTAYNERVINGVRFVDYNNYKPRSVSVDLSDLPLLYESNKLDLVSKIVLEEIKVN